jgi:hypothetical protein
MINRCENSNDRDYRYYGALGVRVCDRWRRSFPAFLEDMGERPSSEHTIDRWPDNNGNYEPGNVRWATRHQQVQNRRPFKLVPHPVPIKDIFAVGTHC